MRAFTLLFGIFLTVATAKAETITACDANKHVGELVTVEGVVSDVHHAKSGKATFINICGAFPNNGFSGVVFSDDAAKFPEIDLLKGKTVDITGRIKSYQGSTETILNDPAQLKIK
jgi:DNA/RNA endonuclease YhcR with UshA esterase domain